MTAVTYEALREAIEPGDVIAFGGKSRLSNVIKLVTRGPVSHVGVVLRREGPGRDFVDVVEATSLGDGRAGVKVSRLSDLAMSYPGEMWSCPLSPESRARLRVDDAIEWAFDQVGRGYDYMGAALAGLDLFDAFALTLGDDDPGTFFCSELVAAFLKFGVLPISLNSSEATPLDVVRFAIYQGSQPTQLRGAPLAISHFNSVIP